MSRLSAALLGGVPPTGRGYYINGPVVPGFDFYVVPGGRLSTARIVNEIGASRCWLFRGPDYWASNPVNAFGILAAESRELGCVGTVVDAERPMDGPTARALGAAMRAEAEFQRVGFTSFPHWGRWAEIGESAGPNVWYSPQIYGKTAQDATSFAAWWDRVVNALGVSETRCILSIAAWESSPLLETPEGYQTYLARLPRKGNGFIAWPQGTTEGWRVDALLAFLGDRCHNRHGDHRARVGR